MSELKNDEPNTSQNKANLSEPIEREFTLSDSSRINTKGFRIDLTGGNYDRFDTNPVMLYAHDDKHVIGYWKDRRIDNGKLLAKPVFDLKDTAAAEIARKVEEGFLRGASLGILPITMDKLGNDYVLTEWELLEASVTPIPSDAGAVRLYNDKRELITFEQLKLSLSDNNNNTKTMEEKDAIVLTATTRQSLGLSANFTAKQIELAVQEKDDKIDELNKKIETLENTRKEAYLSQAVKDGKITESEKANYLALSAGSNFETVKSIIDAKPSQPSISLKDMTQRSILTNGDRQDWTYLRWAKEDPKGLESLKAQNPTEFERLKTTL